MNPISSSGPYVGNDWAVDLNTTNDISTLRLVRISGTTSANFTCTIQVFQNASNPVTITDTSTVSTGVSVTSLYSGTPITQVNGNVGIGTTNPTQKLHVNGYIVGSTVVAFYAVSNAHQPINATSNKILAQSSLTWSTNYNTSTSEFTAPITGIYMFCGGYQMSGSFIAGNAYIYLTQGGAIILGQFANVNHIPSGSTHGSVNGTWVLKINANETVYLVGYQDSTPNNALSGRAFFSGSLIQAI
jgi:hypothetical protein